MVLDAERKNKTIGASSSEVVDFDFEELERRAQMARLGSFKGQENPAMKFGADPSAPMYRRTGDLLAEVRDIRKYALTGL